MGAIFQEGRDRWERGKTRELLNAAEVEAIAALTRCLFGPTDSLVPQIPWGEWGTGRASLAKVQTPEPCPKPENWRVLTHFADDS